MCRGEYSGVDGLRSDRAKCGFYCGVWCVRVRVCAWCGVRVCAWVSVVVVPSLLLNADAKCLPWKQDKF